MSKSAIAAAIKDAEDPPDPLDEDASVPIGDADRGLRRQADILIELAQSAELFHSADGNGFADIDVNGFRATWPIGSNGFKEWLTRRYYEQTGGAPSSEAIRSARSVLQSRARFDAPERTVYLRVGGQDDRLYVVLGARTLTAVA